MRIWILPVLVCLALTTSCTMVGADVRGISLTMDSTSYAVNSLSFLEIRNFTEAPLYVKACTSVYPFYTLTRIGPDDRLTEAYRISCIGSRTQRLIPVDSAIRIQLRLRVDVGRGEDPAGDYRVRVQLHRKPDATDAPVNLEASLSTRFTLR